MGILCLVHLDLGGVLPDLVQVAPAETPLPKCHRLACDAWLGFTVASGGTELYFVTVKAWLEAPGLWIRSTMWKRLELIFLKKHLRVLFWLRSHAGISLTKSTAEECGTALCEAAGFRDWPEFGQEDLGV